MKHYPDFFLKILTSRGLDTPEKIERFLSPDYDRDLQFLRVVASIPR